MEANKNTGGFKRFKKNGIPYAIAAHRISGGCGNVVIIEYELWIQFAIFYGSRQQQTKMLLILIKTWS